MPKTIVLNNHTLGVIYPNGLQILKTSILRGSPYTYDPGVIPFDPTKNHYRAATKKDFDEFRVMFHPEYLKSQ
jgi:hypothetical protein